MSEAVTTHVETPATSSDLPHGDAPASVTRLGHGRRIAIAALALSGFIGLATPTIAWLSARASTRDAAERSRAEADVADVRGILDLAIVDLNALRARTEGRLNTPDQAHRRTFNEAVATAIADGLKIKLRLGAVTPFAAYDAALQRFSEVGRIVLDCNDRHKTWVDSRKVPGGKDFLCAKTRSAKGRLARGRQKQA